MSPFNFLLVLIAEICTIAGQVLFKHALTREDTSRALFAQLLGLGIALKAIEFFLWLGLQAKFPLSYLYPFDALNRIALVAAAWFFLKGAHYSADLVRRGPHHRRRLARLGELSTLRTKGSFYAHPGLLPHLQRGHSPRRCGLRR